MKLWTKGRAQPNLCTGLTEECIIEQGCGSTKLLLLHDLYSFINNSRQDVALLTHDPLPMTH